MEYKSIMINKFTKKSIEAAIDETINDMVKKGWSFVQITGVGGGYGYILIFSRDF